MKSFAPLPFLLITPLFAVGPPVAQSPPHTAAKGPQQPTLLPAKAKARAAHASTDGPDLRKRPTSQPQEEDIDSGPIEGRVDGVPPLIQPSTRPQKSSIGALGTTPTTRHTPLRNDFAGHPEFGSCYWNPVLPLVDPTHVHFQSVPEVLAGLPTIDPEGLPRSLWTWTQLAVVADLECRRPLLRGFLRGFRWYGRPDPHLLLLIGQGASTPLQDSLLVIIPGQFLPPEIPSALLRRIQTGGFPVRAHGHLAWLDPWPMGPRYPEVPRIPNWGVIAQWAWFREPNGRYRAFASLGPSAQPAPPDMLAGGAPPQ